MELERGGTAAESERLMDEVFTLIAGQVVGGLILAGLLFAIDEFYQAVRARFRRRS